MVGESHRVVYNRQGGVMDSDAGSSNGSVIANLCKQFQKCDNRVTLSLVENRNLDVGFLNTYFKAYVHAEFIKHK